MNKYPEIADYFEKAFGSKSPPTAFKNAISLMRNMPDLCARIKAWDETIWSIIQDFLNAGGEVEHEDCFLQACSLLED